MARRGGAENIDPEEMMRRKFKAKCLFRALGRLVMANTYWLIEDIDEYQGLDDVHRRVQQIVRAREKKLLLSVRDKALLNKPAQDRTEAEKKYIYRKIGSLKCFKNYPNTVKRQLAAVTYFRYYGPDRVVVREGQEAHALYFIVSGEVAFSRMEMDELVQEYVSIELGRLVGGDMFGEASLLHNVPRNATYTCTDHCEFLLLMKEDFKTILQATVQKQWDEVRDAMALFSYFDSLDAVSSREGCIMARLKNYHTDQIILGDNCGIPNHVYFILSGRVQMIESMNVFVTKRVGKTFYTLYDPYIPEEESELDIEKKYFAAYQNDSEEGNADDITSLKKAEAGTQTTKTILKSTSKWQSDYQASKSEILIGKSSTDKKSHNAIGELSSILRRSESKIKKSENVLRKSINALEMAAADIDKEKSEMVDEEIQFEYVHRISFDMNKSLKMMCDDRCQSDEKLQKKSRRLETYFMQVCIMNPGSTFGFGENMRDRRIVALEPVKCMLMPSVWLLQRNTANIWTRIKYYLEKKIPKKQKLFEEFCKQRAWEEYKDQVVEDVISRTKSLNFTSLHDVPYSIRMEGLFDI